MSYVNDAFSNEGVTETSQPPYEKFDEVDVSENPNESSTTKHDPSLDPVPWKKVVVTNILISSLIAGVVAMATGLILKSLLDKDIFNLRTHMDMEFLDLHIQTQKIDELEVQINEINIDGIRSRLSALEINVQTLQGNISNTENKLDDKIGEVENNIKENLTNLQGMTECLACKVDIPTMSMANYSFEIQENSPTATFVGTLNGSVCIGNSMAFSYNLNGAPFAINSTTGGIFTDGLLDSELNSLYVFTVWMTQSCSATTKSSPESTVRVYLLDMNDNAPTFIENNYVASIPANSMIGRQIVTVTAVDPDEGDNGKVYYSLSPTDTFDIDQVTGQVSLIRALREDIGLYELNVIARDGGSPIMSATASLSVFVPL